MAATFGTMIHDRALQKMGLINEFAGLMLCLLIGFVSGIGVGVLDNPYPTAEMLDRGLLRSLWVNVLIALLSGAGISIALLRDNTGSLVGVAISASLLPPAVNAGLLWAMSLVYFLSGYETPVTLAGEEPHFTSHYSDSPPVEMAVMGGISLCLTLINIIFIYLTGILMLKVKEVAPNSQAHQRFWRHDVKIARDYNTTLYGASAADILRSVVNERTGADAGNDCGGGDLHSGTPGLDRLLKLSAEFSHMDQHYLGVCHQHQLTWSPSTLPTLPERCSPGAIGRMEDCFRTARHQQQQQQLQQRRTAGAAGGGRTRRFSFSQGAGSNFRSNPNWKLGCSDGYRSLCRVPIAEECRCTKTRPAATAQVSFLMSTPPFNNMGKHPTFLEPLSGGETPAFRTPCAPNSTPTKKSPFFSPSDCSPPGPVLSVSDETKPPDDGRPPKKRRFVVTKAEDTELLLPPA